MHSCGQNATEHVPLLCFCRINSPISLAVSACPRLHHCAHCTRLSTGQILSFEQMQRSVLRRLFDCGASASTTNRPPVRTIDGADSGVSGSAFGSRPHRSRRRVEWRCRLSGHPSSRDSAAQRMSHSAAQHHNITTTSQKAETCAIHKMHIGEPALYAVCERCAVWERCAVATTRNQNQKACHAPSYQGYPQIQGALRVSAGIQALLPRLVHDDGADRPEEVFRPECPQNGGWKTCRPPVRRPPQSARQRVTAVGHRPTGGGRPSTAVG